MENAELRAQVSRLSAGPLRAVRAPGASGMAGPGSGVPSAAAPDSGDGAGPRKISRRKVGKAPGAVAASAVGAAALVDMAQPAAAANGAAVTAGNITKGESRTSVRPTSRAWPGVHRVQCRCAGNEYGGDRGDLYVDKTARLWFCKAGGTTATWVKIV